MLPIQKNKDLVQQINRILRRMEHIKQAKNQLFDFITEVQQLYSTFSQKIHKEMIIFEEKIVKNSLYSTDKTTYIINLAKVYREFSIQLERNSKINIINLERIKSDQIVKQEEKLKKKCDLFIKEFQQYMQSQKNYNNGYNNYNDKCNSLDQTIRRYRSYQDPIAFYNQIITSEYLSELEKQFNDCSNTETSIVNGTQGLDQTRKWMTEHIKEINQYYVILLHIYLVIIEKIINCIVDPKKEENIEKGKLGLRNNDVELIDNQAIELEKLNNLYSSQLGINKQLDDNIIQEYSQLFKKSFNQNQLNSDYKFFYDRCENIRSKKLKTTDEIFKIQTLLINELTLQRSNYQNFEKQYRVIEKDIFTNNGIESFKKRFRKYFGSNFMEIQQLCLTIIERQKRSLEKIGKSFQDSEEKLKKLLDNKQESIKLFEKRTKIILSDHLKLKQRTYSGSLDGEELRVFKESIAQSFNQLKKSFIELEKNESQIDNLFYNNLKSHYQIILKEAISKNLTKILQKERNRVNILTSLNVDSEIVLILKEDSRYEMLLNQCPKPNLFSTFQSLIKKKEYEQTRKLLQMKENRLKNMIRSKKGCCGITSQPIKHNIISSHQSKLVTTQKFKGILNITSMGLIFEQKIWNPFSDGLRLMIPMNDIISFDTKNANDQEVLEINTDFGNLTFESKVCNDIIESMQKNITFKPAREASERGNKKNDSSSFIKNNTSTEFKLSYDKSINNASGEVSKLLNGKVVKNDKAPSNKQKSYEALVKELLKRWKQTCHYSKSFTQIAKNIEKAERRDFMYKNSHSKFYLKERREHQLQGKDLILGYEWKISFPDSPMLHSFKHHQKVRIENISKDLRIRIITGKYFEEQLYIKNKFYKQIEEMNTQLTKFIVNCLEKQADILIEQQQDENKSLESCNIVIDDVNVNLEDRQSKFQTKAELGLRNSRIDKQKSSILFNNSNGFKSA